MKLQRSPSANPEAGLVVLFFALSLIVIGGFAAISIDWGSALDGERRAQFAADAGALAAARIITVAVDDSEVKDEARSLATENGLDSGDVTGVECGMWQPTSDTNGDGNIDSDDQSVFTTADTSSCGGMESGCQSCLASNSVRILTQKNVIAHFGGIIGINSLTPKTHAIALFQGGALGFCIRPFGVYLPSIDSIFPSGDGHFTVSSDSGGNWGKLDIGGNMSSGTNFHDAMLSETCDPEVAVGEDVSTGTGFGGSIKNVFDDMIAAGTDSDMVIALNTSFQNGNGTVTILELIKVDLVSHTGNGNNWQAEFVITERSVIPNTGGGGNANAFLVD